MGREQANFEFLNYTTLTLTTKHCIGESMLETQVKQCIDTIIMKWLITIESRYDDTTLLNSWMDLVDYECLDLIKNVQNSPLTKIVANPQTMGIYLSISIWCTKAHHYPPGLIADVNLSTWIPTIVQTAATRYSYWQGITSWYNINNRGIS